MPTYTGGEELAGSNDKSSRNRKRGCLSSSSSNSMLRNHRIKRAILSSKRRGSSTPVPPWKINARSPLSRSSCSVFSSFETVSARRLANSVWKINKIPSPDLLASNEEKAKNEKVNSKDAYERCSCRRSPSLKKGSNFKKRPKELYNSSVTPEEFPEVIRNHFQTQEQNCYSSSLVSRLCLKLHCAYLKIDELMQEMRYNSDQLLFIRKKFSKEKLAWSNKAQERIRTATHLSLEELKVEKIRKRKAEKLNKQLAADLTKTKAALLKVIKDLHRERSLRKLLEQFCNDLVKGTRDDKAVVEEMKRESMKVQEDLEKERKMLQLADIWREEKVQMKLSEAKFQFEEKNEAVEQLREELEAFLCAKRTKDLPGGGNGQIQECSSSNCHKEHDQLHSSAIENGEVLLDHHTAGGEEEINDEASSADNDMQSIELNLDGNSKSYTWSYATDHIIDSEGRPGLHFSHDDDGESIFSHEIRQRSFCLDENIAEMIRRNFS